jgi:hypothetical protein
MIHYNVTVGTTATLVHKSTVASGSDLMISTNGTGKDVHFGGAGVTTSVFGAHMANTIDNVHFHVPFGQSLYAVVSTTTGDIHVLDVTG